MTQAYPLQWPTGWPRTRTREDSRYRFKSKSGDGWHRPVTFDVARKKLCDELDRLGAKGLVISTNLPLRNDGYPRAAATWGNDPGVAIYFIFKKRQMAMACDRYDAPSANLRSLGLGIEAMRQLDRHGGGAMMERAFAGFAALPPPGYKRPWKDVLGLSDVPTVNISLATISNRYRELAAKKHPDKGGTETAMAELNVARDDALREIGA